MATATTGGLSLRIMCGGKRTLQQQHPHKDCNTSTNLKVNLINYENVGDMKQNEMGKQWIQQKIHLNILMIKENKILCSKNVMKSKSNDKNNTLEEEEDKEDRLKSEELEYRYLL